MTTIQRQPNLEKALAEARAPAGDCEHLWRRCVCGAVIERCDHNVERPLMLPAKRNGCPDCKAADERRAAMAVHLDAHIKRHGLPRHANLRRRPRPQLEQGGPSARERFEAAKKKRTDG